MEAFQQRVLDEKKELDARIIKLEVFIAGQVFHTLPGGEQRRLRQQQAAMGRYSEILRSRIANF